jgi:hypothetical protein
MNPFPYDNQRQSAGHDTSVRAFYGGGILTLPPRDRELVRLAVDHYKHAPKKPRPKPEPEPGPEREAYGRCQLCGGPAVDAYCAAHAWAADPYF